MRYSLIKTSTLLMSEVSLVKTSILSMDVVQLCLCHYSTCTISVVQPV